jgi:predicted S18 family serine protease
MSRIIVAVVLVLLVSASPVFGKSYLLYLEAQGVGGYSSENDEAIYYSMDPVDVMQKPSVGFDYLQRFSSETGDWGSFALQMRLAYNEAYRATGEDEFQVQLYNAFFK